VSFGQANGNNKDSIVKKPPVPKDRNMFGLGIPRGVTINSEGLTQGYVMFAVPNSALVYLINRKGEVVLWSMIKISFKSGELNAIWSKSALYLMEFT
jgi:hypothetical protein